MSSFSGNNAYVAEGNVLKVIDVGNPAKPQMLGAYTNAAFIPPYIEGFAVAGNYVYVTDAQVVLRILDFSDPSRPVQRGIYHTGKPRAAELNPSRPVSYDSPGYPSGVAVSGQFAYVADREAGLHVIDISDPNSPRRIGGLSGAYAWGVAVSGNYAYVAGSFTFGVDPNLHLIDVIDPAQPKRVGIGGGVAYPSSFGTSGEYVVSGNYVYVVNWWGLHIQDVSDPSRPIPLGNYGDPGAKFPSVAVSGQYAYVADASFGLQVIDVSNPAKPQRVGGYSFGGESESVSVAVSGNYAYLADGPAGLQVIDVTNPAKPQRVAGYDTGERAMAVAVSGNYAYVWGQLAGLQVIDIRQLFTNVPSGSLILDRGASNSPSRFYRARSRNGN